MGGAEPPDGPGCCDRALTLAIADAAEAARLASDALARPGLAGVDRSVAHAVLALCQFREGSVEIGLGHLDAARRHAGPAVGSRAALLADHVAAQWHRRRGELAEAAAILAPLHALADRRPPIDAYLTAAALGIVTSLQGDDDTALGQLYQALALARRAGHDRLLVNALNNLGSLQSDLHNFEDAHPMLEECLAGALRLGGRRQIVFAAGNLTQCLCFMGHPVEALTVARRHLVPDEPGDDDPALRRDEELVRALLDNGLAGEADLVLSRDPHHDAMGQEQLTARTFLRARVLIHQGRPADALELCRAREASLAGVGAAGATTLAFDRVELLRVTAQAAAAAGQPALAYTKLEQAWALYERLLGRAAHARRLSLQVTLGLQEAEWERDAARRMAHSLQEANDSLLAQVAENERLQAELRAQALEDPLTGLPNRRHLHQAGAELVERARRDRARLSAAVVDLDHFKQVNDRYGHDAGDGVLQAFARHLLTGLRPYDLFARSGGEEFALLLPGADAGTARTRLDELLAGFRLIVHRAGAERFGCSFSAGVAELEPAESLERLLRRADEQLYGAKAAGRAQVHAAPAPTAGPVVITASADPIPGS